VQRVNIILKRPTKTDVTVTHDPSDEVCIAGVAVGLGKELRALVVEGIIIGTGPVDSAVLCYSATIFIDRLRLVRAWAYG